MTREAIEQGVLTKGQRVEIMNAVAYRALSHTEYPTSAEYNAICQALVAKYPKIRDTIGNGYVSTCNYTGSATKYLTAWCNTNVKMSCLLDFCIHVFT